jgi:FAD/FMN-containing dehydrogenase
MATSPHLTSDLGGQLDGQLITPSDTSYDEARKVFFHGFSRRPAAVARAANAEDVARVVDYARDEGFELAVRSGGHSSAGHGTSEGGIVLDLSQLRSLDIDVGAHTAWADSGLTAGEYTTGVGAQGLVTGFGDTPSVGIAGITLSGGLGFLVRKNGLTIDDLLAAEVVTADGSLLQVDADNHPDLFWAIRGGGGNFGVVTRFKFRLHELEEVVGGMLMLPASPELVASFVAAAAEAPDELSTVANVMLAPPMPFVPAEHHGKPVMIVLLVYAGPAEAGEPAVARLRELAEPVVDMVKPMRYHEIYEVLGEGPSPALIMSRNTFLDTLDSTDAKTILDRLPHSIAPMRAAQLRVLGGAAARVPVDATAFAHRDRGLMVNIAAMYENPADSQTNREWVTGLSQALEQGGPSGYVGFYGDVSEDRVHAAYPGATWDRLVEVKRRYDPTNLFRLNQNVPPN